MGGTKPTKHVRRQKRRVYIENHFKTPMYVILLIFLLITINLFQNAKTEYVNGIIAKKAQEDIVKEEKGEETIQSDVKLQALSNIDIRYYNFMIHVIDVGQADAILIRSGNEYMMIDAGGEDDGIMISNYLQKYGITKLKYLVLTHPHEDHIGGACQVLDTVAIDEILMPNVPANTKIYEEVVNKIIEKQIATTSPNVGDNYSIGRANFQVLASATFEDDLNDASIVLKLVAEGKSFMFMGDASSKVERVILDSVRTNVYNSPLTSDVIKIGHHGSASSSMSEFIMAVNPKIAVISSGKENKYGHPHEEMLLRLYGRDIDILRTDTQGTIALTVSGDKVLTSKIDSAKKLEEQEAQAAAKDVVENEKVDSKSIIEKMFSSTIKIK